MGKGKKQTDSLGKSLIRDKKLSGKNIERSSLHTTDLPDGSDWAKLNLKSITEETNLEEFLATAELSNAEFNAERLNAKLVSGMSTRGVLSKREKIIVRDAQESHKHLLHIPRRPHWDERTSKEELLELEKKDFLAWRHQLAELQEVEHIILTPYERNIEFWRQLWRVIEKSDIVVQIVDARNPLLFWCEDLELYTKESGENKIPILLLNKSDFLTPSQRQMWADYFNKIGKIAVFFSALEQNSETKNEDNTGNSNSSQQTDPCTQDELNSSTGKLKVCKDEKIDVDDNKEKTFKTNPALLSRTELLAFFKKLHHGPKVKEGMTTVGLVGYPNVGKSSTINALLQCKKTSVSATPGKTKHFQTLLIDTDICLCDCPGLVFPNFVSTKAEMIISGILSIDNMTDPIPPVTLIVDVIPRHVLQAMYKILLPLPKEEEDPDKPLTAEVFLNAYGYMRGFITQRGLPDISRSARYILKDFVNGKLLYCHAPPTVSQSDYQTFPSMTITPSAQMTPNQARIFSDDKISIQQMDKAFFGKMLSTAHIKGVQKISSSDSSKTNSTTSINEKPWKKHYNRNKKEKLRKVYSHLNG